MKRLLIINEVCGHTSTGKICGEIAEKYYNEGWEVIIAFGRDNTVPEKYEKYALRITSSHDVRLAALESRIFDDAGFSNKLSTEKFLKWAEEFNPDLVWLHNLHGYYINIDLLFDWLKKHSEIEKKWTLHDCWAFTGHCCFFSMVGCDKWKTQCGHCPQKREYPQSLFFDKSSQNFERKKSAFTGVKKLTLITPSHWLEGLVKQSFLKDYPVEVVYNTVDRTIFKPTPSDFRKNHGFSSQKIIVLGVANVWDKRKGLNVFLRLSEMLDSRFVIVLVGLSEKQRKNLPNKILGLGKTKTQVELAAIYTAADVLVNPSLEETFGMTQVEAYACGTPSIVFKGTACEEVAKLYGNAVVEPSVEALVKTLIKLFY